MLSTKFICRTKDYTTFTHFVPAPMLRRTFMLEAAPQEANVTLCGLGFYELYVNGRHITKGALAPYISNPDDILYFDVYSISSLLHAGKNVIALLLGNGNLNCPGGELWNFHLARYRSAPKVALSFEALYANGEKCCFEADERFRCAPSPVYFDDLRAGEFYDARQEMPLWNTPSFDDAAWTPAILADPPRGECRVCRAEPILVSEEKKPIDIRRACIAPYPPLHPALTEILPMGEEAAREGYLYDFGVNAAGVCRLKLRGRAGQKIILQYGETLDEEGNLDLRGMSFLPRAFNHRDIYICRGEGEETYAPSFTYHGFRYCLAIGLAEEQATADALTYLVMNSALPSRGDFRCSDSLLNRLQSAVRVSDLSNFYYFPTDCPHREKNGWTADAALSCEHTIMNFAPDNSYREWLRCIRKAQTEEGELPGIVPTNAWGFNNGPAWDQVIIELPYCMWRYQGDTAIIRENASAILRYLHFLSTRRDEKGLLSFGLGDWCHGARGGELNRPKAPHVFTSTVVSMEMTRKAAKLLEAVGMTEQAHFAQELYANLRKAARAYLIDFGTMTALGNCQTTQSMALYYHVFDDAEAVAAFQVLLRQIEREGGVMDVGVLGARVLFRVLTRYGQTELAYRMVVSDQYPSYGHLIRRGATTLCEQFLPDHACPPSLNHHFFGDISAWMFEALAGLRVNPYERDANEIAISPCFAAELSHVEASYTAPAGKISIDWTRQNDEVLLRIQLPEGIRCALTLDGAWQTETGMRFQSLSAGRNELRILSAGRKDNMYLRNR